jgi:hypothetical protein
MIFDTIKQNTGNPLLVTFLGPKQTITNGPEYFHNFKAPNTYLSKSYIDAEIESPIVTSNVSFTGLL